MNVLVVEDVVEVRAGIVSMVNNAHPNLEVVGEAGSVVEAAKAVRALKPDLLLLDVELPDGTGFDLLEMLDDPPGVIFITGSEEYAIRAFRVAAIDYLLKPLAADDLAKAIERVAEKGAPAGEQLEIAGSALGDHKDLRKIALHTDRGIRIVPLESIVYCEADGNYTSFMLADQHRIVVSGTLKRFDQDLSDRGFIRVHQSFLINLEHIREFVKTDGGYLQMSNDARIPISTRKRAKVVELLRSIFG